MSKTKVVVIGGGYGGTKLISLLSSKNFEITLIDKNNFHYLQPEIHEFIAGYKNIEDITFNLEKFCEKHFCNFLKDEIINIDFEKKEVIGKESSLNYDYLVVSTGAKTIFPKQIEGLRENTLDVKELSGALHFKQKFDEFLFSKISYKKRFSIIVGGAGLSGIEIASELAFRAREAGLNRERVRVILIEPMESILPGMDSDLIEACKNRLNELEIETIHGQFISKVTKDKVILSNDSEVNYDMFMFTAGIIVNNFLSNVEVNAKNQLVVDDYLRLKGFDREFVLGDIAEIKDKDGNFLPPTAQVAKQNAKVVAKNIESLTNGKDMLSSRDSVKGIMVALGGKYAVGKIGSIRISGYFAHLMKKLVFYIHSKVF